MKLLSNDVLRRHAAEKEAKPLSVSLKGDARG